MLKRIIAGAFAALIVVGCGGGSNTSGDASIYAINANPDIGSITITANGTVVLNTAAYNTTSSSAVTVSSGTGASVFLTNGSNTQLASGTFTFTGGDYYALYAIGNGTSQYIINAPIDVSPPTSITVATPGRLIFTNASVTTVAVDVYVAPSSTVVLTGLQPVIFSLTPFNSGFPAEVNVAPNTYNIFFCASGTQTILATTSATVTSNTIQLLGVTDIAPASTTTSPTQAAITPISINPVTGALPPSSTAKTQVIVGHNAHALDLRGLK